MSEQQRQNEVASQDAEDFGTVLKTPSHPISELRDNSAGTDSTGSYAEGKEMSSDPTIAPQSVSRDAARSEVQIGPVGHEVDGVSGAEVTGGDLTPGQDAGEAMREVQQNRQDESDIMYEQQKGTVGVQREDLKPSVNNPDEGLPPNPDGSENSGGANDPGNGADDASARAAAPNDATVNRASNEGDERFLQLAADFENYKRAVTRREPEIRERAVRGVLEDFLPILDNFERAIAASENMSGDASVRNLRMGIQGILMQMESTLRNHGVEPMKTTGAAFDPLLHEALEAVPDSGQPEGTVLNEAQRGYTLRGVVLRPARVRVAA